MNSPLEPRYLEVWLHHIQVGWLCEAGGSTRFVSTEAFQADSRRPTLSLSLTVPGNEDLTQAVLNNMFDPARYNQRGELPPFFAGLLPEGPLRQRLAATRKDIRDTDDFGMLAAAGGGPRRRRTHPSCQSPQPYPGSARLWRHRRGR